MSAKTEALREAVERLTKRLAEVDASDAGTPSRAAMFSPSDLRTVLQALSLPSTGEGWVLVPREPTEEMLDAVFGTSVVLSRHAARILYAAMLSKAPAGEDMASRDLPLGDQRQAETETWEQLTPAEQWSLAERIAANVGGVVVSEPEHPDSPHAKPSASDTLRRLIGQYRADLDSAHAEICRLQGADRRTRRWPDWSPQANTLRWLDEIEQGLASHDEPVARESFREAVSPSNPSPSEGVREAAQALIDGWESPDWRDKLDGEAKFLALKAALKTALASLNQPEVK
jgi:hypothetical protein